MLEPPKHLSPSAISTFTMCPAQFRYTYIDRFERIEAPVPLGGTLVHAALEKLLWRPPVERTPFNAILDLEAASEDLSEQIATMTLAHDLSEEDLDEFYAAAVDTMGRYFEIEDPTQVTVLGVELRMKMTTAKGTTIHGVIDRLERDGDEILATDYKTGKVPSEYFQQGALNQLNIYAAMCEQVLGILPDAVQLLYLVDGTRIIARPRAAQLRSVNGRADAAMMAITKACEKEDFRPKTSKLCDYCSFKEICPAWA